jgi:hypothetical protein
MKNINEIFELIQAKKREQRELNKEIQEALETSKPYQDVLEQLQTLRAKKFRLEDEARGNLDQKIDLLKLHIKEQNQVISDVALTKIMKGESIRITDANKNEYEPVFTVRFKKTSNKSFYDDADLDEKNKPKN